MRAQFDHGEMIAAIGRRHHRDGGEKLGLWRFDVSMVIAHKQVVLQDNDDAVGRHGYLMADDAHAVDNGSSIWNGGFIEFAYVLMGLNFGTCLLYCTS